MGFWRGGVIFFLLFSLLSTSCFNPFFPDIGTPLQEETSYLTTPQGVLEQLKLSYVNRNIQLFKELIYSPDTFRFYIFKRTDMPLFHKINTITSLNYDFVPKGEYYYTTYSQEIQIHKNLFQQTRNNDIRFDRLTGGIYFVLDSITKDTTGAVISTDKTVITISSRIISDYFNMPRKDFDIGEQVFLLKRDPVTKLWKIKLWFEIS